MKELHRKMNIVVNFALNNTYQHQWLQFNFDIVKSYIHANAVLIPSNSRMSIVPIMSSSIQTELREPSRIFDWRNVALPDYQTRAQMLSIITTRQYYECSTVQELFSFDHRNELKQSKHFAPRNQIKQLIFDIHQDCLLNGFAAFFEATLYKDQKWSNEHMLTEYNAKCLPLNYFPVSQPQLLRTDDKLNVHFWLIGDSVSRKKWYEWNTTSPNITHIHNLNGKASSFQFIRE